MMNTLLESRPQKKRSTGGTIFSIALHTGIVLFAVFATARAGVVKDDEPKTTKVNFVKPPEPAKPVEKTPEPPPPPVKKVVHKVAVVPPTPKVVAAPPKAAPVLAPPIAIPTAIPQIDLSAKVTNEADFNGKGVKGGSENGVEGSNGSTEGAASGIDPNNAYSDFQVERQVHAISGTAIPYPEGMRSSGVEGTVHAEFVVDENGRVQVSTFKVLDATNDLFASAVRNALSRMRFKPAQIGKMNVSQVVQQAFVFKLNR
ncbi:MAG TPA: TonB family protein [Gemmatimonadaceae bacterium]|nr:TonB family protein [Gemmatimonadaceae bacterium]